MPRAVLSVLCLLGACADTADRSLGDLVESQRTLEDAGGDGGRSFDGGHHDLPPFDGLKSCCELLREALGPDAPPRCEEDRCRALWGGHP